MSNELQVNSNHMQLWDDKASLEKVRVLFAPTLSANEFEFFVGLGAAHNLNPFKREIWAVKYDKNQPAQVFIGRDGYRKIAQSHHEYDYHQADSIYENDDFKVINGEINHSYSFMNRGKLVGAYCIARRKSSSRAAYVIVQLESYTTNKSIWAKNPEVMIKKVAEAQCLRGCFQESLGGTYSDSEYESIKNSKQEYSTTESSDKLTQTERVKASYKKRTEEPEVIDAYADEQDDGTLISDETLDALSTIILEKGLPEERLTSALKYFEVENINNMTEFKAMKFIEFLDKIKPN